MSRSSLQLRSGTAVNIEITVIFANKLGASNTSFETKKVIDPFPVFCYIARLKRSSPAISTNSFRMMHNRAITTGINNIESFPLVSQETAN